MADAEHGEGLEQDTEHGDTGKGPKSGKDVTEGILDNLKPLASLPNTLFIAYAVFVAFNTIRNPIAVFSPESAGAVIEYMAMFFLPLAAVAAYNASREKVRATGNISVAVTVFFIVFSMVAELHNETRNRQRMVDRELAVLNAQRAAQQAAAPFINPSPTPPTILPRDGSVSDDVSINDGRLAVPLEDSISLQMSAEPMKTVMLADPAIASVVAVSPYELQVTGKGKGQTSLSIWDRAGYKFAYTVDVE